MESTDQHFIRGFFKTAMELSYGDEDFLRGVNDELYTHIKQAEAFISDMETLQPNYRSILRDDIVKCASANHDMLREWVKQAQEDFNMVDYGKSHPGIGELPDVGATGGSAASNAPAQEQGGFSMTGGGIGGVIGLLLGKLFFPDRPMLGPLLMGAFGGAAGGFMPRIVDWLKGIKEGGGDVAAEASKVVSAKQQGIDPLNLVKDYGKREFEPNDLLRKNIPQATQVPRSGKGMFNPNASVKPEPIAPAQPAMSIPPPSDRQAGLPSNNIPPPPTEAPPTQPTPSSGISNQTPQDANPHPFGDVSRVYNPLPPAPQDTVYPSILPNPVSPPLF